MYLMRRVYCLSVGCPRASPCFCAGACDRYDDGGDENASACEIVVFLLLLSHRAFIIKLCLIFSTMLEYICVWP